MTNLFDLTGKHAVVFGGAGGIGQAIAEGFLEAGAQVMISSRNEESLQRAVKELKESTGCDALYAVCDAVDEEQVQAVLQKAIDEMGSVEILCNSQGFNKPAPTTEFPVDLLQAMFDANVKSVMITCKFFGKYMKENGIHGKIINLSSVRGVRAMLNGDQNGTMGYCTTKGAVQMLTKSFAANLGPDIQVNAIGPTIIYTPMMVGRLPDDPEKRNAMAAAMPAKRIGYPEDCKGPAVFHASEASNFVTGSTIFVDGGLTNVG